MALWHLMKLYVIKRQIMKVLRIVNCLWTFQRAVSALLRHVLRNGILLLDRPCYVGTCHHSMARPGIEDTVSRYGG
jgi:hypothetical protein